jgi:hypothetical protein
LIFCPNCSWEVIIFNSLGVFLLIIGMLGVRTQRQIPFQVFCRSVKWHVEE